MAADRIRHRSASRSTRARRPALVALVAIAIVGCTLTETAVDVPPPAGAPTAAEPRRVLFGIGAEASDGRTTRLAREAPLGMLTSWYNGPGDLAWMAGWATNVVPEVYASGLAHHLVVWTGDAEAPLSTAYGPACGRAYPLSDRFAADMERLAGIFAGRAGGPPLYVTLFTEFQTFPCVDNQWSVSPEATNYYRALTDRYRQTRALFHRVAPNARVSLGWGGWQARWDAPATGGGRSLIPHFQDVMRESDFQSFQAMASDTNVDDVRAMTRLLGAYGPVMVSHYKPDNRSAATFEADVRTMLTDAYLDEVTAAGLFAFSFMDNEHLAASEPVYQSVRAAVARRGGRP